MQRRLCEMSEAKWSITEAKCLQISHNKYASQRDAISHSMGNLMLSHSAGMHNTDKSIAGICPNKFERAKGSKRFHFASLHYIFSAYLPTHIKSLRDFFQSLLNNYRNNLYIISYFIYRNNPDSVENPPIGTETKAVAAIGDGFGFKFHFWWDFTYILHKLVLFHEKSLYLQKQDYQFH